jgi:hypothetical protein
MLLPTLFSLIMVPEAMRTNDHDWNFLNYEPKQMSFLVFFFELLGFVFRVSCLLRRCSTTWATPPAFFVLVISEIGSLTISPGWPLNLDPPDLCLLNGSDYSPEPPHLASSCFRLFSQVFCYSNRRLVNTLFHPKQVSLPQIPVLHHLQQLTL